MSRSIRRRTEVEGIPAYADIASTPQPIDYAYIAVAANRIPAILGAANGRCRFAQVISSGFGEIDAGRALEEELVANARQAGVRVLGPNCLGTYSPRGGLTFPADAPKEAGTIGVISQSGGLSTDIIKRGQWRGLCFSGLVTIGNSADVKPDELLRHYFDDPGTKAIGLYLEDIKDGRAFFDLMRSAEATKPVVILKGGRSRQGGLAAASHTGALAGDDRAWEALQRQTASVLVSNIDTFIDTLLALQYFSLRPDRPTRSITLFGNGGGTSVLGTDAFAEAGLDVSPFAPEVRDKLEALGLPPGTSVANPVDTPVRTLQEKDGWVAGEILDIIYDMADPHAVAMHLNLASFVGRGGVDPVANLFKVIEDIQERHQGRAHFALALRCDGSPELDDAKRAYRQRARAANVPVFDEIDDLAAALSSVAHLENRLARMRTRDRDSSGLGLVGERLDLLGGIAAQPQIPEMRTENGIDVGFEMPEDFRHVVVVANERKCHLYDRAVRRVGGIDLTIRVRRQHLAMIDRNREEIVRRAHAHAARLVDIDLAALVEAEFFRVVAEQDDHQAHTPLSRGGAQSVGVHTHGRRIRLQPDLVRRTVDQVGDLAMYLRLATQIPNVLVLRRACEPGSTVRTRLRRAGGSVRCNRAKQVLRRLRRIADRLFADWDYGAAPGQHLQRGIGVRPGTPERCEIS